MIRNVIEVKKKEQNQNVNFIAYEQLKDHVTFLETEKGREQHGIKKHR